ncbi:hypothetical protein [Sorangium sp. So ce1335]|uniref:hypothetical protein n=1 Tax=Sorangium sp. So ce1335 TaxID=3133335 RepID=UPI003F6129B5
MHIVRDLGVFARSEANEAIGPTDVNAVIESALNIVHAQMKHRARVVRELAPVSRVGGAEGRLTQVSVNLLRLDADFDAVLCNLVMQEGTG